MNKRQKKKNGLLLIKKIYSNWGNKKITSREQTEKNDVEEVKEEAPVEAVKEVKEVEEEDK